MAPEPDWDAARTEMLLDPTAAYLNSGAAGPLPRRVFNRVSGFRRRLAEEPVDFLLRESPELIRKARECLAGFVGSDPSRLVLATNATSAVNTVAASLTFDPPGEILLTDHEYPPMRWCWERAAGRQGSTVRFVRLPMLPSAPDEIVDAAVAAFGARTKVFFFSHVLSTTGMVLPVKRLCAAARERCITTVVDGAHGPAFTDLDLADLGCDYYVGSGHKWLLAPTGTGFMHVTPGAAKRLRPAHVSWGYRRDPEERNPSARDACGRTPLVRELEVEGTRDISPWLALPEAIAFQAALGHDAIRARMRELARHVRRYLTGPGLAPATPEHPELHGGMTAFALSSGADVTGLCRRLWERYRIEIAPAEAAGIPLLRVSTHFFNTESETERLAEALGELKSSA